MSQHTRSDIMNIIVSLGMTISFFMFSYVAFSYFGYTKNLESYNYFIEILNDEESDTKRLEKKYSQSDKYILKILKGKDQQHSVVLSDLRRAIDREKITYLISGLSWVSVFFIFFLIRKRR